MNYTIKTEVAHDSRKNLNNLCFNALVSMREELNKSEQAQDADTFKFSQICELYLAARSARDFLDKKIEEPTKEEKEIKKKNKLKGIVVTEEELETFRNVVKTIDDITLSLDGNNVSLSIH